MDLLESAHRFWPKIASTATGCWLWGASKRGKGYPAFAHGGKSIDGHRYAYRLCVGRIPAGWEIDHTCNVRACVNPDHLRVVPGGWNGAQGFERAARNKRQATHCKRGHLLSGRNDMTQRGGKYRMCRACSRISMRAAEVRYRAKKRAAAAAQER